MLVEPVRNRLLIVDEAWAMCGFGGEVAQSVNELAFDELDAPPARLHSKPCSHPFAPVLEHAMLVHSENIVEAARSVIAGIPPVPDHLQSQGREAPAAIASSGAIDPAVPSPGLQPEKLVAEESGDDEAIKMPFGDLTVSEGKLVSWLRALGDKVEAGETIAEIETDKAVVEIEAPVSGTLTRIDKPVGEIVPMGGRIGGITP